MRNVLEKVTKNDFEEVNALARDVQRQHVNYRPDIFKDVKYPIPKDYFNSLLNDGSLFVYRREGEIIAYIVLLMKEKNVESMHKNKTLLLEQLTVKQLMRGKGIGTEIMNEVMRYAKENSCASIELTVSPENKEAIKFYEQFGMRVKNIKYSITV